MAIERLKFRCYRCNQLLAVAPNKAGTVVSCPKCQSDLLIPGADPRVKGNGEDRGKSEVELRPTAGTESAARAEAAALLGSSQAPAKPRPAPSNLDEIAGLIPPDLADLHRRTSGSRPSSSRV